MEKLTAKYLRWGQRAGGAGWNRHVGKWLRRKANKRLRHFFALVLTRNLRKD